MHLQNGSKNTFPLLLYEHLQNFMQSAFITIFVPRRIYALILLCLLLQVSNQHIVIGEENIDWEEKIVLLLRTTRGLGG